MNNLLGKSILQLEEMLKKKEVSSSEITSYFKTRIKKYDGVLNSFVTVAEDKQGVPIAIKDNFCTEGIRTTASSKLLDSFVPSYESTVTKRLLKKGMQILGKTNMDAWAHGSSTETSDYGATKNPYDVLRIPGGSSGGSAAATAAYLTPGAIGSETAGSIRLPAAWCGTVGLKPTYGRVSRYGAIAMGSSLDCPGPITRTVEDAAYLLGIIAGHDPYDATSSTKPTTQYLNLIQTKKKLKIGICDDYFENVDEEIKVSVMNAIELFKKMGHEIKKIKLISPKYAVSVYTIIQRAEVSSNLARFDGVRFGENRTFFGTEAKKRIMLGAYTLSHGYYDEFYKKAQKVRTLIIEDFNRVFDDIDLIVSPATPMSALKLGDWEQYPFFGETMDILNEPAAVAGIPAISIPTGLDNIGLPIGMQIVGRHFDEETVLQLAYQFEKETNFFDIREKILNKYKD